MLHAAPSAWFAAGWPLHPTSCWLWRLTALLSSLSPGSCQLAGRQEDLPDVWGWPWGSHDGAFFPGSVRLPGPSLGFFQCGFCSVGWTILTPQAWTRQCYSWLEATGSLPKAAATTLSELIRTPRGGFSGPAPIFLEILAPLRYCGSSKSHDGNALLDEDAPKASQCCVPMPCPL